MNTTLSHTIDELTITNIKIMHLTEKIKSGKSQIADAKTIQELKHYHLELARSLDSAIPLKKPLSLIIDELTITNTKIFYLVDKIQKNEHTKADAKKLQELNSYRSQLKNAISEDLGERIEVKI